MIGASTANIVLDVIGIVFILNTLAIIFMVFRERRNPQSILLWAFAFYAIPIFSFLFYGLIGRGPKLSKKKKYLSEVLKNEEYYKLLEKSYSDLEGVSTGLSNDTMDFIAFSAWYNKSPCCIYNEVEIFTDIAEQYERMLQDIKNARHTVDVMYFIYKDSEIGRRLRDLLVEKAQEGVVVRMVIDDFGTWRAGNKFFKPIVKAGGEVVKFLASHIKYLNRNINYRNHRKMVVIDGKIAYTGGANIGDEYANKGKIPWRDTHLRLTGDVALALAMRFLQDYAYATNKKVDADTVIQEQHDVTTVLPMQVVSDGPDSEEQSLKQTYIKLIYGAKKRIWLQTPYYIPDEAFQDALKSAINSGVDVRLMIPGIPDKKYVYYATKSYAAELVKAGAKVYMHPRFIHSKTLLVDDEISAVGTFNLDIRSFKLHFELSNFMYGRDCAKQMQDIFLADQESSKHFDKQAVEDRTRRERFMECIMRIFSPLF